MIRVLLVILFVFLAGISIGTYLGVRFHSSTHARTEYARISEPMQKQMLEHGIDAGEYGVEIAVGRWRIYVAEGTDKSILYGGSDASEAPAVSLVEEDGEITLISAEDSTGRMAFTTPEEGEFIKQSILIEKDGERFVFLDEGFDGFYSRSIALENGRIMWGNLSNEEWYPLKREERDTFAEVDGELVPVRWKDGRLIFAEDEDEERQ